MSEKDEKDVTFEEIFDNIASGEGDGGKDTETPDPNKDAKPKVGEEDVSDKPESDTKDETEDKDKGKDTDDTKEDTYEEVVQKYKSLQGMYDKSETDKRDLEKKLKEKEKPVDEKDKEVDSTPKPEEEQPDPELDKYKEEYDYIHKNEAKIRARELKKFREDLVKEIADTYDLPIKAVNSLIQEKLTEDTKAHQGAIMESHPDYGKEYQKKDILDWVETLSPAKKKTYKEIIEEGEVEEVVDLITDFKAAKGIKPNTEEVDEDNKDKDETKEKARLEKERKLKEMETVKSKKRAIGGDVKKAEDYESAFEEAVKPGK